MGYLVRLILAVSTTVLAGCSTLGTREISSAELASLTPPATVSAEETKEDRQYPVLYGTTRAPSGDGTYSDQRDVQVHYGKVMVKIPKGHVTGSLGKKAIWPWRSDTHLSVQEITPLRSQDDFVGLMQRSLSNIRQTQSDYVVVFIHGFNNSFNDAAIRAAQIGADLDVPENNMIFFSWAARSSIDQYTVDEATVDASEIYLRTFLQSVIQGAGTRQVHVIAHSMGNRALLRTIVASLENASAAQHMQFGQIILAAADVDRDLFAQLGPNYLKVAQRTTVYLSPYDYAVHASGLVHAYPRVGCGDVPQVMIKGIDNVVSFIPDDIPAHAYFAEALPLLVDIKNLIRRNTPERPAPLWNYNNGFWTIGEAVPGALANRMRCKTQTTLHVNAG
ncbi:Esterase/lipase superfamily enzyme [Duganella sacchari]|uniref:Esterase/lipase superfamily enzyme n=1 Tax=Duganella sacchari TaxID=551987 RepID=A0A1M7RBW0_9BURK|nr:alpha/beta hydrolase [Duganella sacchari]SHN43622.1 Esterase/lipase superfamily enzyme [Duganella sacchari]